MSKFNNNKQSNVEVAYSANGNKQEMKSLEQRAYELAVSTLIGRDTFYASSEDQVSEFQNIVDSLVAKGKFDFLANLMLYARSEMNIRNMPIAGVDFMAKALHKQNKSYPKFRQVVANTIQRVDQITDLLSLSIRDGKGKLPMAVKRGLSDAFNKFDEYQFAKYKGKSKEVSLVDAVRIVHPVPKSDKSSAIFSKIIADTLSVPKTWETALSINGQKSEEEKREPKEIWEELIDSKKLGYQAAIKNIRNMLEANVSYEHKVKLAKYIVANAANSKSLPFEYLEALSAISQFGDQVFNNALVEAIDASCVNIPSLGEKVLVMLDTSGSMGGGYFGFDKDHKSAIYNAAFLTAAIASANKMADKFDLILFDSSARYVSLNTAEKVYSNFKYLMNLAKGGSTNFEAALNLASKSGKQYNTVFVLTDGEINAFNSTHYGYHYTNMNTAIESFAPKAKKIVINMEARESTPLPSRNGWIALAGWSPKIFDYIEALDKGNSIVKKLSVPYPYKEI